MPKKESEQFGDSNHKGIFKKILNKLIIIRDYEKKLLIKNKSIASEGYYDSNDKLDEKISDSRERERGFGVTTKFLELLVLVVFGIQWSYLMIIEKIFIILISSTTVQKDY